MFRYVLTSLLGLTLWVSAQTPFDAPYQQENVGRSEVTTLIDEAQEHVFVVAPTLSRDLGNDLYRALKRGVAVYLVVNGQEVSQLVQALANEGAAVKTLAGMREGILVTDYKWLAYGGVISGADSPTNLFDLDLAGTPVMDQLRILWQEAEPL